MITATPERYQLKSLHEDISLLDRKLAHLQNFETFETETLKDAAMRKMHTRRETLIQKARKLTEAGTQFLPAELPVSLRAVASVKARHDSDTAVVESAAQMA